MRLDRVYIDGFKNLNNLEVDFDGVTVDVSTQKEVEGLLREQEAYFRSMADNAPAMLWVTDADGYCTFLSRGWYEFTAQTASTSAPDFHGAGYRWAQVAPQATATAEWTRSSTVIWRRARRY